MSRFDRPDPFRDLPCQAHYDVPSPVAEEEYLASMRPGHVDEFHTPPSTSRRVPLAGGRGAGCGVSEGDGNDTHLTDDERRAA